MATTDGYELTACRWTRIAESGDMSYDVAPAGGECPAVDMARLCAPGAYDPVGGCVEP